MQINVNIKKYFTFLDIKPDIHSPGKTAKKKFAGDIEFRDVCFTYPEWNYFRSFEKDEDKTKSLPAH
jgi:ABC-type multidrug transport system fused ATPase/permease subunit